MIALLKRDLALAVRAGGGFGLGLAFFLIVIFLVPLGVGPESALHRLIAPGILWVAALLASLLTLDRIFAQDWEDGALPLIATSPLPLEAACLAKSAAHWITSGLPLTVGLKRGGLLLSLLVLPLYVPTLIYGAEAVRRGAEGLSTATPLIMLAAITLGSIAILPFASAAVLRINLR